MLGIGMSELLVVLLIVVLFFGGKKLPQLGSALGVKKTVMATKVVLARPNTVV